MKKILMLVVPALLSAGVVSQACQHLRPASKPVPVVQIRDATTGQEETLLAESKDPRTLIVFGNLADKNFVADIKALNKMDAVEKKGLRRIAVVMDTRDLEQIKKFIAENEIKLRVVVPTQEGWQKDWPGVVNRSVFIANARGIVAQGVDVIGNEKLIEETAAKPGPDAS